MNTVGGVDAETLAQQNGLGPIDTLKDLPAEVAEPVEATERADGPQPPRHPEPPPLYAGAMTEQTVRIGGRRLRLSNLDKVLYPETGTTKGEVIDYYSRVAPRLLPHVADRPVTRKRWPDGVGTATDPGDPFFAKALEPGAPAWVRRFPIDHSSGAKD